MQTVIADKRRAEKYATVGTGPVSAEPLFQMSLSFMEVANAVEMFQNPAVTNGFDVKRFVPAEDI